MAKGSNLRKIEREVANLSVKDQQKLMARLTCRLQRARHGKKPRDWTKLYGLGKGLWNGEDAQAYVNRQREDRV